MRAIALFVLIASSLLATIEPVASKPPEITVYRIAYNGSILQMLGTSATGPNGIQSIFAEIKPNTITNLLVDKVSTNLLPQRTLWRGEIAWADTYSKNGVTYVQSILGPVAPNYPENRLAQTYLDKVENGVASRVCTSIGNNFGPGALERLYAGTVGTDGKIYFIANKRRPAGMPSGVPFDDEYGIYRLVSTTNFGMNCSLEKVHSLEAGYFVIQAWRMNDGRFLTERYRYPATKVATEIGIVGLDGKFSPFQIGGDECCQLLVEPRDTSATALYKSAGKYFVRAIRDGRIAGVYEVRGFNASEPVWLSGLNGPWAVATGAGFGRQTQDTIVLVNTQTGLQKVVVSGGKIGTVDVQNIEMPHVTVSDRGDVSFLVRVGPLGVFYTERMTAVTPRIVSLSATPAKIIAGEQAKIKWESQGGESVRLLANGVIIFDNLPTVGEATVSPRLDTTYEVEVLGFGGSAKSSVLVEVTTSTTPVPEYGPDKFASPFYHSEEKSEPGCRQFSPGAIMSLYGKNLSAGGIALYSSLSLPTVLAGTSVYIDGKMVPLYFASPGQVNFQVPYETPEGQVRLWVEVAGVKGPEISILVRATSPCTLRLPSGDPYFSESGGVRTYYATGLGKTNPSVESGSPTPADALYRTEFVPNNIAGTPVKELFFSGLAPGFIGLYQVNAAVLE